MPTVLDLLGVPPPAGISGVSLVPLMTGAQRELGLDAYSEAMYPLHHYGWSDLRALRSGRYKVIDAPRPELYDIDRDPQGNDQPVRRAAGARRPHDRAAAHAGRRVREDRRRRCPPSTSIRKHGSGSRRSATSGRSSPARPIRARGERIRRTRSGCSTSWAQATELSQGSRARTTKPAFDKVVAPAPRGPPAGPAGHRRVVHARARSTCSHDEPDKAVEYFKQTPRAEARLRPRRLQPRPGLPTAGRRRCGAGGIRALPDDRPEGSVRPLPDGRDLARSRATCRAPRSCSGARWRSIRRWRRRKNALGVIALQRGDPAGAERLIREAIATKPDVRLGALQPRAARRAARRRPAGRTGVLRGAEAAPRQLQGGVQPVAALRAGGRSRRPDWRAETVDREQPAVRRGTFLPGQGVSRLGKPPRRGDRHGPEGTGARAAIRVRPARALRPGRRVQPAGTQPGGRAGAGPGRALDAQARAGSGRHGEARPAGRAPSRKQKSPGAAELPGFEWSTPACGQNIQRPPNVTCRAPLQRGRRLVQLRWNPRSSCSDTRPVASSPSRC